MAVSHAPAGLDPERDFERLRPPARRRFLARARRAGQAGRIDLDAAADDAYQEAWLELQRRPDAVAIEHDAAGYLAGIMWHRFHRQELRAARVETAPLGDDSPAGGAEPDAVAEQRETLAAVRDALALLPDRERTALLLRAEGFGHDDIAATLGVSRRIARKLVERGRARLSEELQAGARCASIASTLRAIGLGWPVRGDRRARLEEHLAHCVTCRATVATLRREGALSAVPAVLAGAGPLARALEPLARVFGRGGGEAAAAAVGTKLAVGTVAACVCVVGAVELRPPTAATRPDPAPTPTAVARKAQPPPTAPDALDAAARSRQQGERSAQRAERRSARRRQQTALVRTRTAVRKARAAAALARDGAEQARAGADRARTAAGQARDAGQRAADAGRAAADRGIEAGNRARDAADRVRDALGPFGSG